MTWVPDVQVAAIAIPSAAARIAEHSPAHVVLQRLLSTQMMAALATLPEHWQRVLVMVYVEDQPYSEVAAALGVSVNAARSLAGRARAGMRRALTSTNDRTTLAA